MIKNENLSRRRFIKTLACGIAGAGIIPVLCPIGNEIYALPLFNIPGNDYLKQLIKTAPKARYWVSSHSKTTCLNCHDKETIETGTKYKHENKPVKCLLCAQECIIEEGERGKCRARINVKGELRSLVYGRPITSHIDPIEKKPLYHFLPGKEAFSLATAGCPLSCKFCQNWGISQARPEDYSVEFIEPQRIASSAYNRKVPVIAFTYNEPTVFTEYFLDIAEASKKQGIKNVLISCGFMNEKPLKDMCNMLDAIKIDLKGFSEDFYRNVCGAELKPVLRSIKQVAKSGVHLEIVNLVVPTLNDSEKMLIKLADWIFGEVGPDIPIHFTRFHPDYKMMNLPPTPIATLELARNIAIDKGINYAFVGNAPGHAGNNTFCPGCNKTLIKRRGFFVVENHVINGKCEFCGEKIAGVWE